MLILTLLSAAPASEEGIVGYAWQGCSDCHTNKTPDAVTVTLAAEKTAVSGGETIPLTLTVASTEPTHIQAGLDVGAQDGLLAPSATLLSRDLEITHQFPHPMTDGSITFEMTWTAPVYAGSFTLSGVGNAVDGLSTATGDGWVRSELVMTVSADCSDADGDRVGDCEGDCDDTDDTVNPAAEEVWYDGVDQDCDGNDDDADGDGLGVDADCDDSDATVGACGDSGAPDSAPPDSGAPVSEEGGCRSGKALLLLPLALLVRRRQPRQHG
jgi:hypothetical protein